MEPEIEEKEFDARLEARFKELPNAVQSAITSAEIGEKLRVLSDTHKLHLDQWQALENEVMLALLGFQKAEDLAENIKNEVGVPDELADTLAGDIAETIFLPIRQNLEDELGAPLDPGRETEEESLEIPRETTTAPTPQSATPLETPQIEKIQRVPMPTYAPNEGSHEREDITDDPYREPII